MDKTVGVAKARALVISLSTGSPSGFLIVSATVHCVLSCNDALEFAGSFIFPCSIGVMRKLNVQSGPVELFCS